MTTLRLRQRYLVALGLSSGLFAACSANEGGTTPVATTEPPGGVDVPTSTPTATAIATTTATSAATSAATPTPTSTTLAVVQNGVPTGTFWQPTVYLAVDYSKVPIGEEPGGSCPHGAFCTTEAHAHGKQMAAAPYAKCATAVTDPRQGGMSQDHVSFDPDQTKLERAVKKDACCYTWVISCPGGRPLLVDGAPRVAHAVAGSDWLRPTAALVDEASAFSDHYPPEVRKALGAHYSLEASFEHASVAAFSRVSLSLLGVGAPSDLVADTHRAALDEVSHAEVMYRLASEYVDHPIGPGPLDLDGMKRIETSIEALAREAFIEGCVGEVAAALVLREEAIRAQRAEIRTVLTMIADDEERHAELAFRTLAWAIRKSASAQRELANAGETMRLELSEPLPDREPVGCALPGVTTSRERIEMRRRAIAEVALPCLDALLALPLDGSRLEING